MWRLLYLVTIFTISPAAISNISIAQTIPEQQPSPTPAESSSPTLPPEPSPSPTLPPEPNPSPTQPPSPTPTQPPSPVPKAPIPGQSCEAEIVINGDRLLYRTSYINDDSLQPDGPPVEIDMLKNDSFAAHAVTRYAGDLTFKGTTGTGTPLSFQLNPDKTEIKITHSSRTISGKCGDTLSEISYQDLF